jgi:multicomponent Na+:H+ antiporter subunit E
MRLLLANLVLGLLWMTLTADLTGGNFLLGLALGYLVLRATQGARRRPVYFRKVWETAGFLGFFLKELVVSSLRVAYDVVTPTHHMRPAIIGIPLDVKTDVEITLLSCLLTLTPGTLTLEISPDRRTLYIHAMFVRDPERTRAAIKEGFERRILRLMR